MIKVPLDFVLLFVLLKWLPGRLGPAPWLWSRCFTRITPDPLENRLRTEKLNPFLFLFFFWLRRPHPADDAAHASRNGSADHICSQQETREATATKTTENIPCEVLSTAWVSLDLGPLKGVHRFRWRFSPLLPFCCFWSARCNSRFAFWHVLRIDRPRLGTGFGTTIGVPPVASPPDEPGFFS